MSWIVVAKALPAFIMVTSNHIGSADYANWSRNSKPDSARRANFIIRFEINSTNIAILVVE